jgi:HEAT repeat protein
MSASAITVVVGLLYAWIEARLSFQQLLSVNLVTVLLALALLRFMFTTTTDPFPALLAVIAFDVLWVLQSLEFWGLAGRIFNVRQAKRLFGLIGAGEMLAMVLGGALMPLWLRLVPTLDLYFFSIIGVILSLLMMRYMVVRFLGQASLQTDLSAESTASTPDRPRAQLLRERYIWLMFALAAITIFTLYFTDNAYYDTAEKQFSNPEELAAFFGLFLSVAGFTQLIVRAVLSGWLLNRFGVVVGLLVLPVALLIASAAAIGAQILGLSALVFGLVMLVKLLDRSLRYSLNRAAQLVLYQPLTPKERTWAQTAAESVIEPLAGISSGLVLLFLNQVLHFDALRLLLVMMGVIVIWLGVVTLLNREYSEALVKALNRRRFSGVTLSYRDGATVAILQQTLHSPRPTEVIYALNMLSNMQHEALDTFLTQLLSHPAPEVRQTVLDKIEKQRRTTLIAALTARLSAEPDAFLLSYLLRVLCGLGAESEVLPYLDHAEPTVRAGAMIGLLQRANTPARNTLLGLIDSPNVAERVFVAQVIGEAQPTYFNADYVLETYLTEDEAPEVRRAATIAAGKVRHPALYPLIVTNLEYTHDGLAAAVQTLSAAGDEVLPLLVAAFQRKDQPRHVLIRLLRIMGKIGGAKISAWLWTQVHYPDEFVRYYVLEALATCGWQADGENGIVVVNLIQIEVAEAAWNLAAALEMSSEPRAAIMQRALEQELHLTRQRILLLLALLHDPASLRSVQENFAHPTKEKRAYALEILDTLLPQEHKAFILPLFETRNIAVQLQQLQLLHPQTTLPLVERIRTIVLGQYREIHPWTKACAFYLLGEIGTKQHSMDVASVLMETTDVIVRETALWALYRLNPVMYTLYQQTLRDIENKTTGQRMSVLARSTLSATASIAKEMRGQGKMLLLVEKVIVLRTVHIFANTPEDYLAEIAMVLKEIEVEAGETFIRKGEAGDCLYIIASGKVRVHDEEREIITLGEREVVGELALLDAEPRNADVSAIEKTMLLRLDQEAFFELITNNPEVVRGVMRVLTKRIRTMMARAN